MPVGRDTATTFGSLRQPPVEYAVWPTTASPKFVTFMGIVCTAVHRSVPTSYAKRVFVDELGKGPAPPHTSAFPPKTRPDAQIRAAGIVRFVLHRLGPGS